jgi:hypothetical protein
MVKTTAKARLATPPRTLKAAAPVVAADMVVPVVLVVVTAALAARVASVVHGDVDLHTMVRPSLDFMVDYQVDFPRDLMGITVHRRLPTTAAHAMVIITAPIMALEALVVAGVGAHGVVEASSVVVVAVASTLPSS